MHRWKNEEIEWLRANVGGVAYTDLLAKFNHHFKCDLNLWQLRGAIGYYKIPPNAKWKWPKSDEKWPEHWKPRGGNTRFKKGHTGYGTRPPGTVRLLHDGYLQINVGAGKWVYLHRVIYEGINGPIPKSHRVIFADGDKTNLSPSNLLCVSNSQLVIMNKYGLRYDNAELTKLGALSAKVKEVARQRKLKMSK